MKIKHFFSTITGMLIVGMMPLNSCKKVLDLKPQSAFDESYVFSNVANVTSAVYGVYASLATAWGGGLASYGYDSDEFTNYVSAPSDNGIGDVCRYKATPTNSFLPGVFNALYSGIERANICIKDIPKMDMYKNGAATDKAQLQRLYGEALTLRAEFYFDLIRNWGDVPAPFVPSIDQNSLNLPKTDRDVIYDHIIADLLTAENLVPWRNDAGVAVDERITKGAVKGLRARFALFAGGYSLRKSKTMERRTDYLKLYQIAHDECAGIMARADIHSLNPSFQSVWKDAVMNFKIEPRGEVLFEIAFGQGAYGKIGYKDGPRFYVPGITTQLGSGGVRALPTYFYSFNPVDTRRDVTIATYYLNPDKSVAVQAILDATSGKYRPDWLNPYPASANQFLGINWYMLRLSDVLLMFAETDNEINNGPTAAGINAYEAVRKRAFAGNIGQMGVTPTTHDAFFQAIVNERHYEFGGEGLRKFDLIRWNLIAATFTQMHIDLNAMTIGAAPYNLLPKVMWYKTGQTTPVYGNSLYAPTPAGAVPTGYLTANWVVKGFKYTNYANFIAQNFTPNHSELLPLPQSLLDSDPNVHQDYGY
ncbi:MAG: RagB/SusD domain protein [Mucilaginibacter sp.]|jgi:hypothetical protein|nr:RagB/SusD domain protein [Mucilaginibacter sp.]